MTGQSLEYAYAHLKLVYANWDRQKPEQREAMQNTAEHHLSQIKHL